MSYSRINTFIMCPLQYFYTYCLLEERVFGAAASLGSTLHSVLEKTDFNKPLDLDSMRQLFVENREIHDPKHEITDELLAAGDEMMIEFIDRHDGDTFDIIAKEMPFAIVVGQALITGYIDRVDRTSDDAIFFHDYKSGKYEVAAKNISQDLQLGIYALAMSKYFPNTPIRGDLYYLRSGKMKGHNFTLEDLDKIEERLIEIVKQMIELTNHLPTPNKFNCKICDYRRNKLCATGVKRWPDLP